MSYSLQLCFLLASCLAIGSAIHYSPVVQLPRGKVQGLVVDVEDGQPVNVFHGIRYGRAQRFSAPRPVDKWSGIYNATQLQFACPQAGIPFGTKPKAGYTALTSSEDCLFLSIWAPAKASSVKRPVMVWIHGGAFVIGTQASYTTDGKFLASYGDVIVVSINYRLGILGFLYAGEHASTNRGLLDQILALKFIQESIEAFGGDRKAITIFGQSAGAMSVGSLILSQLSSGLFHRAIMQSGAPLAVQSKAEALTTAKELAAKVNCSADTIELSLGCMLKKSVPELIAVQPGLMLPVVGTADLVLPYKPTIDLKTGQFNHQIDLLFGNTNDETMGIFAAMFRLSENSTSADLSIEKARQALGILFAGKNATEIGDFYLKNVNASDPFAIRKAISDAYSDLTMVCPTVLFAEGMAKVEKPQQKGSFYSYRLLQSLSVGGFGCEPGVGVCHSADVPFIFGGPIELRGVLFTEDDYQLSRDLVGAWTRFARSGRPGTIGGVEWKEAFSSEGRTPETSYMSLHVRNYKMVSGRYRTNCDAFWKAKILV